MKVLALIAVPVKEPTNPSYCHPELAKFPVGAEVLRPLSPKVMIALDFGTKVSEIIVARSVDTDHTQPLFPAVQRPCIDIAILLQPDPETKTNPQTAERAEDEQIFTN
jgi:hypothetical protein